MVAWIMFPLSLLLKSRMRPLGTYSKNNKNFFHPRDMKFSKNLSCFTSHPKYNGLLGEILFSSFLTCSIISFHLFIITSNDQKYEFESNELFFRSLAAITFGNILSWSNQDLDLYPAQRVRNQQFSMTHRVHGISFHVFISSVS